MSDDEVICIQSSEDEMENVPPAVNVNAKKPDKRKREDSLRLSGDTCKKQKVEEKGERENGGGRYSPKPGTSKYFDKIEGVRSKKEDKKVVKPTLVVKERVSLSDGSNDEFDEFIQACKNDRRADSDIKTALQKMKKKYDKLEKIHKEDVLFKTFLKERTSELQNKKFCNTLLKVKEEINRRAQMPAVQEAEGENEIENENESGHEQVDMDFSKSELKRIRKVKSAIDVCIKRIKKLEEAEVEFSEDENSAYIMEDKYKKRLVYLYEKLSDLMKDQSMKAEVLKKKIKRQDIKDPLTGIDAIDNEIIKFVNRQIVKLNRLKQIKTPSALCDYIEAPDSADIYKIIKLKNQKLDLGLSKKTMEAKVKIALEGMINHLKKKRERETKNYLKGLEAEFSAKSENSTADPAKEDSELRMKLEKNKKISDKRIEAEFNHYVLKAEGLTPEELAKEEEGSDAGDQTEEEADQNVISDNEMSNEISDKDKEATDTDEEISMENSKCKSKRSSSDREDSVERDEEKAKKDVEVEGGSLTNLKSLNTTSDGCIEISGDKDKKSTVDSNKKVDDENPRKIEKNSDDSKEVAKISEKAVPVTRESVDTEEFELALTPDVAVEEQVEEDPLEIPEKVQDATDDTASKVSLLSKPKTECSEKKTSDHAKSKNSSLDEDSKTTPNSLPAEKLSEKDVCIVIDDDDEDDNDFHAKKDKSAEKIINTNESVSLIPLVSRNSVSKEKKTNIVKPLQVQRDLPKTDDKTVSSPKSVKISKERISKVSEIEVIDSDESGPKSPESDIIIEEEFTKETTPPSPPVRKGILGVKSFAKQPDTWKDSLSPTKQKVLPSRPMPNPMAMSNRRLTPNVVYVENYINNYGMPTTSNDRRGGIVMESRSDPRNVQQQLGKFRLLPKNSKVIINQCAGSSSHSNQRPMYPASSVRQAHPYKQISLPRKDRK